METQVADILAQRAKLDSGFAGGVLLSILIHGTMMGLAVYAAVHTPPPKIASALNIKFAPVKPAPAVEPVKAATPTPKIESPKPQPLKPIETKKAPEKNTVPLSPFGKSTKKGSENPVVTPPTPAPATDTAPVSAQLEGGDFPYTLYIDRMTTTIGSHFFRPQGASVPVVVVFTIDRDGTIRDASVETSSGNGVLDRAALRAVLESSPLGTLPFGYQGTYLRVHLKFR